METTLERFTHREEVRAILGLRSTMDKFAIEHGASSPGLREIIDGGYAYWIDRTFLYGYYCNVFKLTAAGIALCEELGIAQHE